MTDAVRFDAALTRSGKSKDAMAKKLGISPKTLTEKIRCRSDFTAQEMLIVVRELGLHPSEASAIFFLT